MTEPARIERGVSVEWCPTADDPESVPLSARDKAYLGGTERRRFFAPFDDSTEKTCRRCGESRPLGEFIRDATKRVGRGSICKPCDREKSRDYYAANRERVLAKVAAKRPVPSPRVCEECGDPLEGRQRVVCSARCRDARSRRLNPEAYAERERRKVERRREARRKAREQ
jgi:hypothetical protein